WELLTRAHEILAQLGEVEPSVLELLPEGRIALESGAVVEGYIIGITLWQLAAQFESAAAPIASNQPGRPPTVAADHEAEFLALLDGFCRSVPRALRELRRGPPLEALVTAGPLPSA